MDVPNESIRIAAALFGSLVFASLRCPTWRHWCIMMLPGAGFGVFVAPLACEGVSAQLSLTWLHCGDLHTDVAVAFVAALLGHTASRALLFGAENWAPEWVQAFVRRMLGIQEPKPAEPRTYVRPNSDPPPGMVP
jgi:hypothetical protein